MKRLRQLKHKIRDDYNPEGLRGKDAFLIFCGAIIIFLLVINFLLWTLKPEQEWIRKILYPMMG